MKKDKMYHLSDNEEFIIKACINNNRNAQKELYMKYKNAMFTTCYRITGNYEDAADALQNGFIEVFNCLEKFGGRSSLGAWIKTIMVRSAIKKIRTVIFKDIDEDENAIVFKPDDSLTGEMLEKAILELHPGYRTVFNLIEIEGYKHNEVAEMLGITVGTSKSQLFKAKNELRKKLELLFD